MKQLITLLATVIFCTAVAAQTDTTKKEKPDTIRIGGIIIVKNGKNKNDKIDRDINIRMGRSHNQRRKNANVSTNWWIVDLGFANYTDNTNYANAGSYLVNRPPLSTYPAMDKNSFKLNAGKSINVNFWFFMQRLNVIKHYVNLEYGFGLELNNYRYKSSQSISYKEGGYVPYTAGTQTNAPFIFRDSVNFTKNKLAADYLTVPLMLNFATNPGSHKKGISLSAGVSAGYLYSQRNKQRSSERGKDHNKGDYDLQRFKFSYVADLGLGPIHFYGSYSPQSFYEHSLDMKPYNVGIRFSNW